MKKKISSDYAKKLKDPRWQKLRLEILERDEWSCQYCYDSSTTLHIHHLAYFENREPWDIEPKYLMTLCEDCHKDESKVSAQSKRRLLLSLAACGYSSKDLEDLAEVFEKIYNHDGLMCPSDKDRLSELLFPLFTILWYGNFKEVSELIHTQSIATGV